MAHRVGQSRTESRVATPASTANTLAWLRTWWESNRRVVTHALLAVLCMRLALGLIVVLATAYLPVQQGLHYVYNDSNNIWLAGWARWDSEWYIGMAQYGILGRDEFPGFFPLYPALLSFLAPLFGHDYVLSGMVISSLACFIAFAYLLKLTSLEFGEEAARRTLLYLAVYPMSFFLLAVYTESLFLACTVAAFYHARRGQWAFAGLAAFLAALTRVNGILLVLPIAYEAWRQSGVTLRGLRQSFRLFTLDRMIAIVGAPLGLLTWMRYLQSTVHDPLAYFHRQSQIPWSHVPSTPWNTLLLAIQDTFRSDLSLLTRIVNGTDLIAGLLLIAATMAAGRWLPRAYALYLAATFVLLFSSVPLNWPLQSLPRYLVVLFPCFMLLGRLGRDQRWDRAILLMSLPLLGLFTALFAMSYWVF